MQWRCRQEVEDALWKSARSVLPASALDRKRLLHAITERTALYTSDRDQLASTKGQVMPASDLAARALFFSLADAAKISIPLSELAGRGLLPVGERWKLLDLGAGAGAMGLGVLSYAADFHPGLALDIEAVDLDEGALKIYSGAVAALNDIDLELGKSNIVTRCQSASSLEISPNSYDLVILGSMLNELEEREAAELVNRAMTSVRAGGALLIIEPALRETSRGLHRVRDRLLEQGAHVFAPCTRSTGPCPALADQRDWCHEDRPVVLPTRARQMAQATGLRDGGLKFSYLVLRHEDDPLVVVEGGQSALRVVSQPQRGKGQRECFACGQEGRQRLRLLKRNRGGSNRIYERSRRGDVLLVEEGTLVAGDRSDIPKGARVELVRPAELE